LKENLIPMAHIAAKTANKMDTVFIKTGFGISSIWLLPKNRAKNSVTTVMLTI
jgi:hypothetical protein